MPMFDFLNVLPSLIQGIDGYQKVKAGYDMQISSAKMSAKAYRQAADLTGKIANYNIELDRQQLVKNLNVASKDISKFMATNRTQMATTGISSSSKSYLQLANASMNTFTQQVADARADQLLTAQQRLYNAKLQEVDLLNKAQSSDYEAKVAKYYQKQEQGQMFGKAFSTLLGGLGGMF